MSIRPQDQPPFGGNDPAPQPIPKWIWIVVGIVVGGVFRFAWKQGWFAGLFGALILFVPVSASAQTTTPVLTPAAVEQAAAVELALLKARIEQLQAELKIRELEVAIEAAERAPKAAERADAEKVRTDRKTTRDVLHTRSSEGPEGKTIDTVEATQKGAKHVERMADIERKRAVGIEKARNPTCGWLGCSQMVPLYGNYGGYYSLGVNTGGAGYVTPYGATGWGGHRERR
ncbi:hypothetical protein HZA26_01660 [Candidatus Nomurabacteria bacterium]|nr:hypothetical protein [Candidatus Nomurabacteria bacterium]